MESHSKSIKDVAALEGKYVLLRSSLNVPVKDGVVKNQFRLLRGLVTINFLVNAGAKVILCGHISNSKETEKEESLKPVLDVLKLHLKIKMSDSVATAHSKCLGDELENGEVLLLENLRQDPREKKNDADFARTLASMADIYVNDAFAAGHREHASIVGVTKFLPSYFGLNFLHEKEELDKTTKPESPSIFLLGGAKFDTKMPLVEKYLNIYDRVFIGGALANDFFNAKGLPVGKSLISDVNIEDLKKLLNSDKLILPIDVTVADDSSMRVCLPEEVADNEAILDAGPRTTEMLGDLIKDAKMVLWNGPFGNYEKGFAKETVDTAKNIAKSEAYSVIGGGDTIAAIEHLGTPEKYNFLSTAGGAMLNYLEHGTLPAIEAVLNSQR